MTQRRNPDPAQGIFETMLVVRGAPVAAAAHLERLGASLEAVYGAGLPAHAQRLVAERAEDLRLGRVRLTATPSSPVGPTQLGLAIDSGELGRWPHFPEQAVSLHPHPVSGGLGMPQVGRSRRAAPRRPRRGPPARRRRPSSRGHLGQRLRRPRRGPLHTPARRPDPARRHPRDGDRACPGPGHRGDRAPPPARRAAASRRGLPHQLDPGRRGGRLGRRHRTRPLHSAHRSARGRAASHLGPRPALGARHLGPESETAAPKGGRSHPVSREPVTTV